MRSVHREWFVRYRFPGHEGSSFIESTAGRTPEGWAMVTVADLATLVRRSANPSDHPTALYDHYSLPAFDNGCLPSTEAGALILSGKYAVPRECVLLSKLNPRIPRIWFVKSESDLAVASTEFLVWEGRRVSSAWLWATLSGDAFRSKLVGASGGTSTSHQRVKPQDVENHRLVHPATTVLRQFDAIAEPALDEVSTLRKLNRRLATTRDLLLPRLLTGRLDISDVDLGGLLTEAA